LPAFIVLGAAADSLSLTVSAAAQFVAYPLQLPNSEHLTGEKGLLSLDLAFVRGQGKSN
jgi:hypothetical protein